MTDEEIQSQEVSYLGQEGIFRTFKSTRDAIFNNIFIPSVSSHLPKLHKPNYTSIVKQKPALINFQENPNILLAIQNNMNIMHFIINCKGHKDLLAYIYVQTTENIKLIIKNPNGFPLILMQIPVDNNYIFTQTTNLCYDFPIRDILRRDIKFIKKNAYNIIYRKAEEQSSLSNIQFVFELFNSDNTINTTFVLENIKINSLSVINNLFKIPRETKQIDEFQYLIGFQNLNIIVLRNISDINAMVSFVNKSDVKFTSMLSITNNKLNFILNSARRKEIKEIANNENSVIWNYTGQDAEYKLAPFENIFKTNFNKIYSTSERIYYIFGVFCNIYVFIKFISSTYIREKPDSNILDKIFNDKFQLFECYYCI
jgi:hypothetical protein